MVHIPTARDAMSDWRVILAPDTDLLEAIVQLVDRRAAGAPVVDDRGHLVGVLTEKDCLRLLSNSAYGEVTGGRVKDYMSTVKAKLSADMDIFRVTEAFLQTNFPILPVLEGEKLLGRVARLDALARVEQLCRAIQRQRELTEKEMREQRNPRSIDQLQRLTARHTPAQLAAMLRGRD